MSVKIVKPSIEVLDYIDGNLLLRKIEAAGRTCYKSEHKITENSAPDFVRNIIKNGHETVIEHEKVTVRVICDRGVSHEIVRHRIGSYSQESTRYCDYEGEMQFIDIQPHFKNEQSKLIWRKLMVECSAVYDTLRNIGEAPQLARSVLPNSLKTDIVITFNLREWRHFFKLRTSKKAHPQMREVACLILKEFKTLIPVVFEDINETY
jgi:thymidylate synthase (FAD)